MSGFLIPFFTTPSTALVGEAILAVYTSSLWTQFCQALSQFPPWRSLVTVVATYSILLLLASSVYPWYPKLMDNFHIAAIFLMWFSLRRYHAIKNKDKPSDSAPSKRERQRKKGSYVTMFGKTIRRLSTVLEEDEIEEMEEEEEEEEEGERQKLAAHVNRVKQLLLSESTELKTFDRKLVMGQLCYLTTGMSFYQLN